MNGSDGLTNISEKDNESIEIKPVKVDKKATEENKRPKKKITIEVDEDDPCLKKDVDSNVQENEKGTHRAPGQDPRFQQQNQTLRCWVMYTDFYRCEHILGEGSSTCTWFKDVFTSICPNDWIRRWDTHRAEGKFPWHKYKTEGEFPGRTYGG